jgi:hypothetical protein
MCLQTRASAARERGGERGGGEADDDDQSKVKTEESREPPRAGEEEEEDVMMYKEHFLQREFVAWPTGFALLNPAKEWCLREWISPDQPNVEYIFIHYIPLPPLCQTPRNARLWAHHVKIESISCLFCTLPFFILNYTLCIILLISREQVMIIQPTTYTVWPL